MLTALTPREGPAVFQEALESVARAESRPDLLVEEISAPARLAPYSFALSADVAPGGSESDSEWGTGRLVLLCDPDEQEGWHGPLRIVCFAQAPLESELGTDPFLTGVAWSWLIDALDSRSAAYTAAAGTATKTLSTGFGELADSGDGAQVELRASWTPLQTDVSAHIEGWAEMVCLLAGLPPVGEGVSSLTVRRVRRG